MRVGQLGQRGEERDQAMSQKRDAKLVFKGLITKVTDPSLIQTKPN